RYRQAVETLPDSIAATEAAGAFSQNRSLRSWLALAALRVGDIDAARSAASSVLHGRYETPSLGHAVLCEVAVAEGDTGTAIDQGRRAVELAASGDWVVLQADVRLALAGALAAAGDTDGAAAEAVAAAELSQGKGYAAGVDQATAITAADRV